NNLKQLGTAMHNYHTVYKCFPKNAYGGMANPSSIAPQWNPWENFSANYKLLPFLDQESLFSQFSFMGDSFALYAEGPNAPMQQVVPTLRCRSAPLFPWTNFNYWNGPGSNYAWCSGSSVCCSRVEPA